MNAVIHEKNRKAILNIKSIRTQKGYSQEYMAMKMKISQNTFSKLELGYMEISLTRFLQIAEILEVEYNSLLVTTAPLLPLVIKSQRYLNCNFAKSAIHRVVTPFATGLAGLTNLSA
ncbi:helix-turn-helix domain-containing protein [Mucilaginibacter sp. FT3.2]|uniref:helix-turn-helix domain-containing protein n=1 Tax=Mucilaginibacter sp. FT3.2 TaxID=2723090 RepID=UPI0016167F68|nr:helix-turn-helix transcriptional regulator [Mucilaginibacter sp. FT3.2]MBB6234025.1 transcriptional regulator with XRE-family HTH domain [Mucilaginibacter sp. FT3.2]